VFANAWSEFVATIGDEFFRVVETDDAALGIQNDGSGDYGAEQRAASRFIEACDARPAEFASRAFESGAAKTSHEDGAILACRHGSGRQESGVSMENLKSWRMRAIRD